MKEQIIFNYVFVKGIPVEFEDADFKRDLQIIKGAEKSVKIRILKDRENEEEVTAFFDFKTFERECELFKKII